VTGVASVIPCASEECVIRAAPSVARGAPPAATWVLVATILGSSMASIDGTAVNVALPALQRALHATAADVQWVVDVYHMMLYLFAAAAALGTKGAEQWVGQRVIELIEMGGPRFIEHLQATGPPDQTQATADAWAKLLHYLSENRDSLWYGKRMQEGLPIGSGLIEGGAKLGQPVTGICPRQQASIAGLIGAQLDLPVSDQVALHFRSVRGVDEVASVSRVEGVLEVARRRPRMDHRDIGVAEISEPSGGAQDCDAAEYHKDESGRQSGPGPTPQNRFSHVKTPCPSGPGEHCFGPFTTLSGILTPFG